jgi:tungstate transport system substrate-binding protein
MATGAAIAGTHVVLASTTSTQNTGLLDTLIQAYYSWAKAKYKDVRIDVVAVGTGAALEIARRGDADLLLVHDPEAEEAFVSKGYGVDRQEVMYNDFVILGPSKDPAGIRKAGSAVSAFRMIFESGTVFVSRGDESGTHDREKKLWKLAGAEVRHMKGFVTSGQGMLAALKTADGLEAYILSDRGTFLTVRDGLKKITLLYEEDPVLDNQYSVMAVNPAKFPHVFYEAALDFIKFITGPEGQKLIGDFRDKHGNVLFNPNAGREKAGIKKIA